MGAANGSGSTSFNRAPIGDFTGDYKVCHFAEIDLNCSDYIEFVILKYNFQEKRLICWGDVSCIKKIKLTEGISIGTDSKRKLEQRNTASC